jgi:plasmid stability protein
MSTTLTIRTDERLRAALEERARLHGKSVSQVAREILTSALEQRPLGLRTGYLKGRLRLAEDRPESWRAALRERNWRP